MHHGSTMESPLTFVDYLFFFTWPWSLLLWGFPMFLYKFIVCTKSKCTHNKLNNFYNNIQIDKDFIMSLNSLNWYNKLIKTQKILRSQYNIKYPCYFKELAHTYWEFKILKRQTIKINIWAMFRELSDDGKRREIKMNR